LKKIFSNFYQNLFLLPRLFIGLGVVTLLFLLSFFFEWIGDVPEVMFWGLIAALLLDIFLLYHQAGVFSRRVAPERLSNGDENQIGLYVENFYPFKVGLDIIDEIPHQFQKRDVSFETQLTPRQHKLINYMLRPVKRGEYAFGCLRVYVTSPLKLISRRYTFDQSEVLPVYPSFLQLRKYQLMAISNRLSEVGIKKIRRIGNSMEFEQIKSYVAGDDPRTVNWKATARHNALMVNNYTEERAQHVYCVIDKSRVMKMPFDGLSMLDYAINASLVLSNVALLKEDKAGLITISDKKGAVVPAERRPTQLNKIMEVLYKEKTRYLETDLDLLYSIIRNTLKQRSLVMFFTNFESLSGLQRQLPYLKRIARYHLLVVIFFENTGLRDLSRKPANDIEGVYIKTIAEKFMYEKKLIVKELTRHGIQCLLTAPQNLTVNTINRYIEIKAAQKI
jgi:uncharacterized protein (DUF58 family)